MKYLPEFILCALIIQDTKPLSHAPRSQAIHLMFTSYITISCIFIKFLDPNLCHILLTSALRRYRRIMAAIICLIKANPSTPTCGVQQ